MQVNFWFFFNTRALTIKKNVLKSFFVLNLQAFSLE